MPSIMTSHRRLRTVSWIAILAIVTSVLAPVAARGMAAWSGSGSPWDEICTSLGLTKAAPSAADRTPALPTLPEGTAGRACPDCLPSASPDALPSQPTGVPPAVERSNHRFLFFFISAAPPIAVPDAIRPRAPPRAS